MFTNPISVVSFGSKKISTAEEAVKMIIEKNQDGAYIKMGDNFEFYPVKTFNKLNNFDYNDKMDFSKKISELVIKRRELTAESTNSICKVTKGFTPSLVKALVECFPNLKKVLMIVNGKELLLPANKKAINAFKKSPIGDFYEIQELTMPIGDARNEIRESLRNNTEGTELESLFADVPLQSKNCLDFSIVESMIDKTNVEGLKLARTVNG
jgi:hypothetical protein